jgi:RHS repeat-associated protein
MPIPSATLRGLRGNLLSDGVRTFTYDAANRLTSVTSGTLTTTFEYDGLGNRTAQTVDGVTTEYVLDVAGGLPEVIVATTGGASTRYVQVQGQVLAQQDSGAWTHILPDHLGSVRQVVGSDSQVDLAQSFDPFGGSFGSAGSGASEFGYTGEWWDAEAELLYLRARYYEPGVGRFSSKDPWPGTAWQSQTLNRYTYVLNRPLQGGDPSGHQGPVPGAGVLPPPQPIDPVVLRQTAELLRQEIQSAGPYAPIVVVVGSVAAVTYAGVGYGAPAAAYWVDMGPSYPLPDVIVPQSPYVQPTWVLPGTSTLYAIHLCEPQIELPPDVISESELYLPAYLKRPHVPPREAYPGQLEGKLQKGPPPRKGPPGPPPPLPPIPPTWYERLGEILKDPDTPIHTKIMLAAYSGVRFIMSWFGNPPELP